ncbi:MAG: Na(+)-translocating NADH-quinone reductase subunit A [Rhizobiaceae bacterium]
MDQQIDATINSCIFEWCLPTFWNRSESCFMESNRAFSIKGLDIPIKGAPSTIIDDAQRVDAVAVLGADYVGLEPKLLVREGELVSLGQPLFQHKRDPAIQFVAPSHGTVSRINRGERRVLKSVVIDVAPGTESDGHLEAAASSDIPADQLRERLLKSGFWTAFRTRPFSRIPASDAEPRSIFVTACETRPLAGAPDVVVAEYEEAFSLGLDLLARLSNGAVFLCTGANWSGPTGTASSIEHAVFEGPHPAGLPGTHIHHLDPVGSEPDVWHIGYQDVIAIGKLIGDGLYWTERIVALGGDGFSNPRMVRTRLGADIVALCAGEIVGSGLNNSAVRLISGCVLSGRHAQSSEAFLGRYHLQVSAVPHKQSHRRRHWQKKRENRYSFSGILSHFRNHHLNAEFTTDQNGRASAMVPIDAFERLIPMDVLAAPLLKSLLIQDTDQAQALGCLELDEEDLALCSFVCPGKNDYSSVLRQNLDVIEKDG